MSEMRQLVQFVRHAGQCAETFHRVLRHRFLDVAVYCQFIDHLGKRLADPFALEQQFGIILPVEIDFDGTVPFLSRRQFRTTAFLRSIAASVKMCSGTHAVSSLLRCPAAFRHVRRFCGTQNLYLLPEHIPTSAYARHLKYVFVSINTTVLSSGLAMPPASERRIFEYDFIDHLVEPVGNPLPVQVADLLRDKVGRDERERPVFVTPRQQIDHRSVDVPELLHFQRFGSHVIYAEHFRVAKIQKPLVIASAQVGDVSGIHDRHAVCLFVIIVRQPEDIEQVLERPHHGGLAVTARPAQDYAGTLAGGQARGKFAYLQLNRSGTGKRTATAAHFAFNGTHEQLFCRIFIERQPKTALRNPRLNEP